MTIQNSDKLIVGRGDESYQVSLSDSGLAEKDDVVSKVGGDSMQGPLQVTGGRSRDDNGNEGTIKVLNVDSGQNSSLNLKWNGNSKVYIGDEQTSFQGHIKFNVAGKQIYSGDNTSKKGLAFYDNGVQYVGDYTADKHIATKKNVEEAIYHDITDTSTNKYVDRAGDQMSGNLAIDTSDVSTNIEAGLKLKGSRGNTTNSAATITFQNKQSSAIGYLTYRSYGAGSWFAFNQDVDLNNKGLHSVAQVRMQPGGYIGSAANPRLTVNNASGSGDGDGLLVVPRPSNNRRGFTIRGNDALGVEKDILYTYTNPNGTPDAINYLGKMDSGYNLVNKEYVDNVIGTTMPKNINTLPLLST